MFSFYFILSFSFHSFTSLHNQKSILHHFTLALFCVCAHPQFTYFLIFVRFPLLFFFLCKNIASSSLSLALYANAVRAGVSAIHSSHCLFVRILFRIFGVFFSSSFSVFSFSFESKMKSTRSKQQDPLPQPQPVNKVNSKWLIFFSFRSFFRSPCVPTIHIPCVLLIQPKSLRSRCSRYVWSGSTTGIYIFF